jgi:hypothetical protein
MSLTLAEQAKLTNDPLKRGVISTFTEESQVLKFLPFSNIAGNSLTFNRESTLGNVGFRDYNEEYTEGGSTVDQVTATVKIFGGVVDVDRALVKTQNSNDMLQIQRAAKVKAMARFFEWAFFGSENTSANNEYFDGMRYQISGDQLLDHAGAQLDLDSLDELLDTVKGTNKVLFMNKKIRRKINSLMRSAGQAMESVGTRFGQQFYGYAGVPIAEIAEDHQGNDILDFSETSAGSTSIYCISFGSDQCAGLQAGGGMQVYDHGLISGSPYYRLDVEWLAVPVLYNLKAAARLKDVAEPA